MAGTIVISKKVLFGLSSRQFDYLTERIERACEPGDEALKTEVFRPMHEGGMDFISATPLSSSALIRFRAIVLRARDAATFDHKAFEVYGPLWDKLDQFLAADPRLLASGV